MRRLILASTSPYRRELLARLRLTFETTRPEIDESARKGEAPLDLARRLAAGKAATARADDAVVIGADQVAALDNRILRKPGDPVRAVEQLMSCQGGMVDFFTAVHVLDGPARAEHYTTDHTRVYFRSLPRDAIERYVELEQAYDSAGGFKIESLGVILFRRIDSRDPTALMGLPMIWLASTLAKLGMSPLS